MASRVLQITSINVNLIKHPDPCWRILTLFSNLFFQKSKGNQNWERLQVNNTPLVNKNRFAITKAAKAYFRSRSPIQLQTL
jgi:hypothetical protein